VAYRKWLGYFFVAFGVVGFGFAALFPDLAIATATCGLLSLFLK
jgi:hypothetical protein